MQPRHGSITGRARRSALVCTPLLALALVSCTPSQPEPPAPSGDTMRAMWARKDPFTRAVFGVGLKSRDDFLQSLRSTDGTFPSVYWDGTSDPAELGLDDGGVAVYNLVEQDTSAMLEVLITTGSAAHPETYTCFAVTLDIARGYVVDANSTVDDDPETHCAPEIVETLGPDAQLYPVETFAG